MTRHAPPAVSPNRGTTRPNLEIRPPQPYARHGFVLSQSSPPVRPASPRGIGPAVDSIVAMTDCGAYVGIRPPPTRTFGCLTGCATRPISSPFGPSSSWQKEGIPHAVASPCSWKPRLPCGVRCRRVWLCAVFWNLHWFHGSRPRVQLDRRCGRTECHSDLDERRHYQPRGLHRNDHHEPNRELPD